MLLSHLSRRGSPPSTSHRLLMWKEYFKALLANLQPFPHLHSETCQFLGFFSGRQMGTHFLILVVPGCVSAKAHRSEVSETGRGLLEQARGTALLNSFPDSRDAERRLCCAFQSRDSICQAACQSKLTGIWRRRVASRRRRAGQPSGIDWLDCGARRTRSGGGGAPLERRAHLARAPSSGHREDVGLGLEGSG